jgi:hypothetical protein
MAKNSKQQAAIAMSMKAAGKKPKMAPGGSFKPVDTSKNPGLAKLPTEVRNKMGYAKKGGTKKYQGNMTGSQVKPATYPPVNNPSVGRFEPKQMTPTNTPSPMAKKGGTVKSKKKK